MNKCRKCSKEIEKGFVCLDCQKESARLKTKEWVLKNKDRVKEYNKKWVFEKYNKTKKLKTAEDLEFYLWKKHLCNGGNRDPIKGKLSRQEIKILLINQDLKCKLTKLEFENSTFFLPSIDRINSNKPYSLKNCQIILTGLNMLKNRYSNKDLKLFISRIKNNVTIDK